MRNFEIRNVRPITLNNHKCLSYEIWRELDHPGGWCFAGHYTIDYKKIKAALAWGRISRGWVLVGAGPARFGYSRMVGNKREWLGRERIAALVAANAI